MQIRGIDVSDLTEKTNLLQTKFWGEFKSLFGWKANAVEIEGQQLLVLSRQIKIGTIAYIPHGPVSDKISLAEAAAAIAEQLEITPVTVRFDLPWSIEKDTDFSLNGLVKSPVDVQVPTTVFVSLAESEDDILGAMKRKTRYNIRLSFKKGVEVREGDSSEIEKWYSMYQTTAQRDKISIHSLKYYKSLFETMKNNPEIRIRLYFAEHEGYLLAGIIVAEHGDRATYLFGASTNEKRNLMPTYGLQWTAMQNAKATGCTEYDLFGIPPADDPKHPMFGLYRVKTGFGGQIIYRPGCWDFPVKKAVYNMFRIGEKARNYYYKVWKKR